MGLKTADFDFPLPADRIAQHPAKPRDSARLLLVSQGAAAELQDRRVHDLPGILRPGDLLIFNDTKVIPAQLTGRKGEAKIEVTLIRRDPGDARAWEAFAKPGKKLKVGDVVEFGGLTAVVQSKQASGEIALRFDCAETEMMAALHRIGAMPLPPAIASIGPRCFSRQYALPSGPETVTSAPTRRFVNT